MEVKAEDNSELEILNLLQAAPALKGVRSYQSSLLAGDGSGRSFHRLNLEPAQKINDTIVGSAVLIRTPAGIGPKLSGDITMTQPQALVQLAKYFPGCGIPTPALYSTNTDSSLILTEDVGDLAFYQIIDHLKSAKAAHSKNWEAIDLLVEQYSDLLVPELFKQAIHLIKVLQSIPQDSKLICFRKFLAFENYRTELQEFSDFYLADKIRSSEATELQKIYDNISETISSFPKTLSYFDYNTHNLFVTSDGHLRVLDYQDACLTSPARDIFSLINDRGMNELIGDDLHQYLYAYYKLHLDVKDDFDFTYDITALHWDLRVAGRFVKLNQKFDTDRYAQWIPSTLRRLSSTLKKLQKSFDKVSDLIEITCRASPEFKEYYLQ